MVNDCRPCEEILCTESGCIKRMKKPPVKVLEEIHFKSTVPAVTCGIVVWGNSSSDIMDSLNPVQARTARIIYRYEILNS